MTKTLTEQWRDGTLPDGFYYMLIDCGAGEFTYINEVYDKCPQDYNDEYIKEVLAPVPSYDSLYNPECGIFPVLEIIVRNIENMQKRRTLTDLECGIKSQVVSLLKLWKV